jgi:hypothetical protein
MAFGDDLLTSLVTGIATQTWWVRALVGAGVGSLLLVAIPPIFTGGKHSNERPADNSSASVGRDGLAVSGNNNTIYLNRSPQPRFSQTQTIGRLPERGKPDTINLDNLGTLKLFVPSNDHSVTLLLDVIPLDLPDKYTKEMTVTGLKFYNHMSGKQYTFDTGEFKRHEIEAGGRTFVVSLLRIAQVTDMPAFYEYEFGISEK